MDTLRNDLSHAMSGNSEDDRLQCGRIYRIWDGHDDVAWPNDRDPEAYGYEEIVKKAAWLRAFQSDLFSIADPVFKNPRPSGKAPAPAIDLIEPFSPAAWNDITQDSLDRARAGELAGIEVTLPEPA